MFGKVFFAVAASLIIYVTTAHAHENKPRVTVIDFGQLSGAMTGKLNTDKIGMMCVDYIIEALADSGKFFLVDREFVAEKLSGKKFNVSGNIPPSLIREIGEILGVDYLIIGNVFGVGGEQTVLEIVSNGAKVNSVKACIIARMVDIRTGNIVAMAEGRGESKSSLVKVGKDNLGFITVGTKKVPQVSVHNSVKKATIPLVEEFVRAISNWRRRD